MTASLPTADEQLKFLHKLQRLFDEADFTATYKYALLMSLADLAVEDGLDGKDLALPMGRIAEKFAGYYWPQSAPYASGRNDTHLGVLYQNLGMQAAVINHLSSLRAAGSRTLRDAKVQPGWKRQISKIARIVHVMPVVHLQNIGSETDPFLYELPSTGQPLILRADVIHNLREFHAIIHRLARSGWLEHVRGNRRNHSIIGDRDELEEFMFGANRRDLSKVAAVLKDDQSGTCFYCQKPIRGEGDVDHFIAWSRYPKDTAHNFVLSHASCNRSKSDFLAARQHLERWMMRNADRGEELGRELSESGLLIHLDATLAIGRWAYQQGFATQAHGWIERQKLMPVDASYLTLFL